MKTKALLQTLLVAFVFSAMPAAAQKGVEDGSKYGHGEDSIRALQNLSMYQQFVKQRAYVEAVAPWRVIFAEAPKISKNMYIHGVTIYKTLFSKTQDAALRKGYVDTIMMIYDQREKYFGQRGEVRFRKAQDLSDLDKSRSAEAYNILAEAIDLEGNQIPETAINLYMQLALGLYLDNAITKEAMVDNFSKSMDIIDHKMRVATDSARLATITQVGDNAQLIFSNSGAADCETLVPVLEKKYNANPDDMANVSSILNLMKVVKCEDSELFARAAEKLHQNEPSATSAYNLGKYFLAKKQFDKTIPYYEEAISLEENDNMKIRYYSELTRIMFAAEKAPTETRRVARKALELNPNDGNALLVIGRLYAQYNKSISDVAFEQITAYWAAVDKFMQAKRVDPTVAEEADKLIATYSAYFPSQEDAFFNDLTDGQSWTVPGWIGESTKVRVRK